MSNEQNKQVDAGARDGELISRLLYAEKGSDNPHDKAMLREAAERLTALSASTEAAPEGCTPADAKMLRAANHGLAAENDALREALQFYADGSHFIMHSSEAWDTVSGEPPNFWEDESSTATVEDGSIAKLTLAKHSATASDTEGA